MAILTQAHQGLKFKDANAQIIGMTGTAELAVMTLSKDGWVAIGGAPLDRNILNLHKNNTNGIFVTHRNDTGFVVNRTYADFNNDGTTIEYQERIGVDGNIGSIGMFSNHALALRTNNTDRLYIKNDGNVGIGTTSPAVRLDFGIATGKAFHLYTSGADYYGFNMLQYDSGPFSTNIFAGNGGEIKLRTASGTSTQSTRLTVKAGGNVGIGTTNPIMKLQVLGDIYANNGNVFIDSGRRLVWGNSAQFIEATNSTSMEFSGGSGSIDMTLLANGNVGIGTTSPSSKLNISSASYNDHITLTRSSDELGISVSGGQLTFEGGVTPFNTIDKINS